MIDETALRIQYRKRFTEELESKTSNLKVQQKRPSVPLALTLVRTE